MGANLVLGHFENGARILGGGSVQRDKGGREVYLVVELANGSRELVVPELLASLAAYAFLRERNATLVLALRSRALEWCKERGLSKTFTWAVLPSTFKFAWNVSPVEAEARDSLSCGPSPPLWWGST
jgi:hypothetical protein